nr:DoxX family protein [Gordonia sp. KTR9]
MPLFSPKASDRPLAQILLRVSIGGTMIAHGVMHGRSLAGTSSWFESIGFRLPSAQARTSAVIETGAGAAVLVGGATPLACSAVIGTMAVAARSVHMQNGFFITSEGWEYVANLSCAAAALAAIGPGRLSIDRALGIDDKLRPGISTALATGFGLAAAGLQLAIFHRPQSGL